MINKTEILDQIDSLREYCYFEFNLSKQNDDFNDFDLNRTAEIVREEYCKQKNIESWKDQEPCDNLMAEPKHFDADLWKKLVDDYFESIINSL